MASISIGLASLLGAGIAGGSALGAGAMQSGAANSAAQLQYGLGEQALNFEKQQYATGQQELMPWLQGGQQALGALESGLGLGAGGTGVGALNAPFTQQFQAPSLAQAESYPGYQFQLQQGENAIQNSAAARGGLNSGNAATALNNYAQGTAQSDYTNVYNQAMQQYLNSFNIYNTNQANAYNRLASLAGLGQTAATTLGQQGNQAASTIGNISGTIGGQVGSSLINAGAAGASGLVGAGNAATGGLSNYAMSPYLSAILGQALQGNTGQNTGSSYGAPQQSQADLQGLGMLSTPGAIV
jgi:hypothetical protein